MRSFVFIGIVLAFAIVALPLKAQERTGAELLQECRVIPVPSTTPT